MTRFHGKRRRSLGLALMHVAGRVLLALMFISVALGFLAFDSFAVPSEAEVRRATAGIVFTGAFERVDAGLQLLDAGAIPLLYISGVNAGAGILPARFVSQFSYRNPNIANLQELVACCVEWGEDANTTFQNALETKCWVARRDLAGPFLLITSRRHMARAMAALSVTLPGRALIAFPVEDALAQGQSLRLRAIEYLKYLGAFAAIRATSIVSAEPFARPLAEPCPNTR